MSKTRRKYLLIGISLALVMAVVGCSSAPSASPNQSASTAATKKVTAVNAYMQVLDSKNLPDGDKFTEKVFPSHDAKLSLYVSALVPKGYEIDYWLINNVKYSFNKAVTAFTVFDLDESTVYEAVFKKTATVATVTISCINARFSGGGYTNATSGTVPKGTKITLTGISDVGSPVVWVINGDIRTDTQGKKSITFTVNSNTTFKYTGYN